MGLLPPRGRRPSGPKAPPTGQRTPSHAAIEVEGMPHVPGPADDQRGARRDGGRGRVSLSMASALLSSIPPTATTLTRWDFAERARRRARSRLRRRADSLSSLEGGLARSGASCGLHGATTLPVGSLEPRLDVCVLARRTPTVATLGPDGLNFAAEGLARANHVFLRIRRLKMCADSREPTSQVGQGRTRAGNVQARPSMPADNWIHLSAQSQALRSWARAVRAESRNQRHIAVLRRALDQTTRFGR